MKKIRIIFFLIVYSLFILVGCSSKEVYSDDNIIAQFETIDNRLDLDIRFRIHSTTAPDISEQTLSTFESTHEYLIQLSDGTYYGYQDATLNEDCEIYTKSYSTLSEIEKDLNMNIISSNMIKYPEEGINFSLQYHPGDSISIKSASAKAETFNFLDEKILQIEFEGTDDYTTRVMMDISENIRHEELQTKSRDRVDVFVDETKGKAGVYLLSTGYIYSWLLDGIQSFDDVKNFVSSLE